MGSVPRHSTPPPSPVSTPARPLLLLLLVPLLRRSAHCRRRHCAPLPCLVSPPSCPLGQAVPWASGDHHSTTDVCSAHWVSPFELALRRNTVCRWEVAASSPGGLVFAAAPPLLLCARSGRLSLVRWRQKRGRCACSEDFLPVPPSLPVHLLWQFPSSFGGPLFGHVRSVVRGRGAFFFFLSLFAVCPFALSKRVFFNTQTIC